MKILTVTVPMYNVESYIDQCLKSFVVPGAEEKLEVLVVNDGSPDHSRDIAQKYTEKYPSIFRIIDKETAVMVQRSIVGSRKQKENTLKSWTEMTGWIGKLF